MKYLFLLIAGCFFNFSLLAQDENLRYDDWIYNPNIKSVKFHIDGLPLSYPILFLGSRGQLKLSFDELRADGKSYVYTIEHCDKNWETSDLPENFFMEGFNEEDIDDYEYSFNTKTLYTHYNLWLPNRDIQIKISGNYLLKVYEDEDEKTLALTRRFIVVDETTDVRARLSRTGMVSKNRTHQEIDFWVEHEDFDIRNPMSSLSATVLQNGNWQTAIKDLRPKFTRPEEQSFDYTDKIVFLSGKEFRYVDLRRFDTPTSSILEINKNEDAIELYLFGDEKRRGETYFDYLDNNGHFVIENRDGRIYSADGGRDSIFINEEGREVAVRTRGRSLFSQRWLQDADLESEYANVLFSLKSPTIYDESDIYVYGGLTDWQFKDEFKMVYNHAINGYVCKAELKQGYYDYLFVEKPKDKNVPDWEATEGDWWEAENEYLILIYYRPFGGRHDQLIGARTINSRDRY